MRNTAGLGGAIYSDQSENIVNCRFIGNMALEAGGAVCFEGTELDMTSCTLFGNEAPSAKACYVGDQAAFSIVNTILWDGGDEIGVGENALAQVAYSDVHGGWPGEGNINVDPLFVDPGYWDPNGTPDDPNDDFFVEGDYHLQSQAGRWNPATEGWVIDEVTSPCIDAGDPMSPIGDEPFPNGGILNLGAYGGSVEASKSYFGEPACETHLAGDINGDCKVDLLDLLIVVSQWTEGVPGPVPPVVIVEPQDGDVFEDPSEPILIRVEVTDPGFQVTNVHINTTQASENVNYHGGFTARKGSDGWSIQWSPPAPRGGDPRGGDYTIVAEASDHGYRLETSPPVVITIRPSP